MRKLGWPTEARGKLWDEVLGKCKLCYRNNPTRSMVHSHTQLTECLEMHFPTNRPLSVLWLLIWNFAVCSIIQYHTVWRGRKWLFQFLTHSWMRVRENQGKISSFTQEIFDKLTRLRNVQHIFQAHPSKRKKFNIVKLFPLKHPVYVVSLSLELLKLTFDYLVKGIIFSGKNSEIEKFRIDWNVATLL